MEELKERCWGHLEGGPSNQLYTVEQHEEKDPFFIPIDGIEPRYILKERIVRGLNAILEQADEPLIVSHGCLFFSLCELLEFPITQHIPNTTLIECIPTTDGWQLNISPTVSLATP